MCKNISNTKSKVRSSGATMPLVVLPLYLTARHRSTSRTSFSLEVLKCAMLGGISWAQYWFGATIVVTLTTIGPGSKGAPDVRSTETEEAASDLRKDPMVSEHKVAQFRRCKTRLDSSLDWTEVEYSSVLARLLLGMIIFMKRMIQFIFLHQIISFFITN